MSLVEDILYVLRMVLDYFGVPPEMLVPVWDTQLCGQYRSIVRMIGTNLPLKPTPRAHFQIPLITYKPHGYIEVEAEAPAIPTFADVMWVFDYEGESFARTRNHLPPKKDGIFSQDLMRFPRLAQNQAERRGGGECVRQRADPEALQKITQLESELLKLRAQIAMIVTAAPSSALTETQNAPFSPLMSPAPLPALTSTPRHAPPPPPPPPPLPPPCQSSFSEKSSAMDLIKQRRNNNSNKGQLQAQHSGLNKNMENKLIPSMLDVLRDLNQVKLRSVQRSPGGTPVRRRSIKCDTALLNDPAALIARALKKKFAQHRHNTSSDKENSLERSPFGSPDTPPVSHHARRSQGRRHLLTG
ncbi:mitochondrial fission regulator 2 [Xiphophorus hellerii]|uniref:mitochondrial fission regulator 2 n=1 Tax=Xiphophorus hellerii TaxID=8084 RepID=UPI0013B3C646|nr:mitochondrial fission regulator 2 [Xiphophorus hellerii]XP_032441275.1 mitochondrial fission regulator 2 [Xiphophorus hellerii]XP_032441276.1 mitochondrial fission regulator 2 [Xiphophorus hellerii]